ncbi:hypothetical protein HBI26_214770 [Parastagonospora nodorum]|nr:hypothetical protein HBH42_218440 [Parastagonospora nodorum]KAH4921186.1 hypothetical protein HBI79_185960 [Parastagonospora nodorum]KAH4978231.1 hypothetical protein HBI76_211200 [Parastagonospora nodorum]KAH5066295.1 hypothetical protein HBH95_204700 [Parastagonospora nodorum]KAH5171812.1 hypothetical protein HBH68_207320 [Parastagonospora nodorum]
MDDDDDFGFSDSDLDDLPANTLQHLEANAVRATQHQQQAGPESDYGLDEGDEVVNLDDDNAAAHHAYSVAAPEYTQPQQTDYAYDDSNGQQQLYADQMEVEEQPYRSQADPGQLLSRIKKLEQEKARERKQADDLKGKLQTKSGEADTLRRRHDAESRSYERKIADQQQLHSSELAKMRAEIERLRREKEQAQTDNMFNQHDSMAQRTRRSMPSRPKGKATAATSPAGTPKRAQKTKGPLGDGFDDDDVVMASPSKLRDRLKAVTPKQASKRKRTVTDQSPIPLPALQLSAPRTQPREKEIDSAPEQVIDTALLQHFREDDRRFTLLHRLLAHPSSNGEDRILEALTQHAFPTQPSKKLSSIVYDALAAATASDVHELALRICNIVLDLWKRCLDERYYDPVYLMLDAIHFVLACEPIQTAVQVTEKAVPLIIASVDLVSLPVSNAAKLGGKAVASLFTPTQRDIASKIDVLDCLELLYLIATSSVSSTESAAISRLWQGIPSGFCLMLLNKEYPQPQITLMLRILSTSALSTSVGPIVAEDESQSNVEDAIIARLTNLFTEIPKQIPDPSAKSPPAAVTEAEVWEMRLLVLMVLTQFSISKHGCIRLAQNPLCIGRLIKYLDYCINTLYRQPLSPTQDQKIESINATMKLIYHIATSNPGLDIKSKLVNTLGGQHSYLVALSRLTFSEGLMLEAGIEDAVVDMAHSILDEGLSLEEGDAFGMVFSSGSSV